MDTQLSHNLSSLSPKARSWLDRPAAHYIDGAWHPAKATLPVIDPASSEQVGVIGRGATADIDLAVRAARRALVSPAWQGIGPVGRERLMLTLAQLIEENAAHIAQVETVDNGMPGWFAFGLNVMGAADVYRYYAGWPTKLTGRTMDVSGPPGWNKLIGMTRREPVGVIGGIVPWNVPFMMAAWKIAPALAAGCTIVLKPAEDTSLSTLLLAELAEQAGFPPGVINIVTGIGSEVGEALVSHPDIAKISFTGSTVTGRHVGARAGQLLKRVTLELGGKSPTIIFGDADLDAAVMGAANSIFMNSGQICVAGSRLYVQDSAYDQVMDKLAAHLNTVTVGAGLNDGVFMGPLVNARQQARVRDYVAAAKADGLEVITGQDVEGARGYFVSPAIVAGAGEDHPITCEEIFGPVLSVYRFSDAGEVVIRANDSSYGLSASIWSRNADNLLPVAEALQCGKVSLNNGGFPYPGLPEGGYKASGFGRDLGADAVEQNLQTKTILLSV